MDISFLDFLEIKDPPTAFGTNLSLDRKGFEVCTISAVNLAPMEQKYSFILFEALCLSKMAWLDSFKLTMFAD